MGPIWPFTYQFSRSTDWHTSVWLRKTGSCVDTVGDFTFWLRLSL